MRRARKGRFAVGEFKQSGELFERPWACRQAGAKPSEPVIRSGTIGHLNGCPFLCIFDFRFNSSLPLFSLSLMHASD